MELRAKCDQLWVQWYRMVHDGGFNFDLRAFDVRRNWFKGTGSGVSLRRARSGLMGTVSAGAGYTPEPRADGNPSRNVEASKVV